MKRAIRFLILIVSLLAGAVHAYGDDACRALDENARASVLQHIQRDSGVPLDVPLAIVAN